jgi:DNA-binding MarR family transcriptional regulator
VTSRTLTAEDYRSLAEFRYQIRSYLHFSERAARNAGLNPQQHQLLLAVKGLPDDCEANIGAIAARLHIRHHSAVELTERLVRKKLVRKRRYGNDRRRVLIELTDRGESVLRKLSLTHRAQLESAGSELLRALNKLIKRHTQPNATRSSPKKNAQRSR